VRRREAIGEDRRVRARWWGHTTVGLELAGVRLLTDPVLTGSIAFLRRRAGAVPTADAGEVDAVLVSHLHADHCHVPSLQRLDPAVRLLVPEGAAAVFRSAGAAGLAARCEELPPGANATVTGPAGASVVVETAAAAHDPRRSPWSRHRGAALESTITGGGRRVWFPGDTGLHEQMCTLGPVDLGLVPVGGWGPSLGPGHLDPSRATEATRRVGIAHVVPVHYGTFWPVGLDRVRPDLFAPPGAEYAARCAAVCPATAVHVLTHGEVLELGSDLHAAADLDLGADADAGAGGGGDHDTDLDAGCGPVSSGRPR